MSTSAHMDFPTFNATNPTKAKFVAPMEAFVTAVLTAALLL
jgi:hypothetical protein